MIIPTFFEVVEQVGERESWVDAISVRNITKPNNKMLPCPFRMAPEAAEQQP